MSAQDLIERVCIRRGTEHSKDGIQAFLMRGEMRIFVTLTGLESTLSALEAHFDREFAEVQTDELFFVCTLSGFRRNAKLPQNTTATLVSWRTEVTEEHFRRPTALLPTAQSTSDMEQARLGACEERDGVVTDEIDVDLGSLTT